MSGILGADQFGRLIDASPEPPPDPDVAEVGRRLPEPWEIDSRARAILADRARCNELLSGLVRS